MRIRPPEGWRTRGIFVGGCVERGEGSSFRARAHAHVEPSDPYHGWTCIRSAKRLGEYVLADDGEIDGQITRPSTLLYHEEAHHHLPAYVGHGERFARKMVELCGYSNIKRLGNRWYRKGRQPTYPPGH